MKRVLFFLFGICLAGCIMAQPAKSRVKKNAATKGTETVATDRASLMFPTSVAVPADAAWRRDIYRSLDLKKDQNAPLYYPVDARGNEQNLFTLMFRLFSTGKLPVYKYTTDGVEDFRTDNRSKFKEFLDRYDIYHEIEGNSIKVADSDIPSSEVLSFFIKESSYYDQYTATYHTRVTAICPVLHRAADEFSMDEQKRPLFWVKYDDLAPYLSKQMIMTSNLNNASRMSIDDYFSTNQYKGEIYMTTNMQNRALQDYCPTDSAMAKEQKRIEKEMKDFEKNIWTTPVDSAELARQDSIAAAQSAKSKSKKSSASARTSRRGGNAEVEKSEKPKSSSASAPRVSVRRQRR
jgi:gliding motility associated protien GldN